VTSGQLALAWLLHQDDPARVALLGPRTLEQYEAALPSLDLELTAEVLARLNSAGA
jgi:aryl-alcohol dehydrogenase-like predicted oxidoreductase